MTTYTWLPSVKVGDPNALPVPALAMGLRTDPPITVYVPVVRDNAPEEEQHLPNVYYVEHRDEVSIVEAYVMERAQRHSTRGAVERLFKSIGEYLQGVPRDVPWLLHPFIYFGGVTMLAGIWKGGKSEYAAGIVRSRVEGKPFLGQDLPNGPTFLVTEEGGISMAEKYDDVDGFEVLDARDMAFADANLWDVLHSIEAEVTGQRAFVIIDTFITLTAVEEENDSAEVTAAIRRLMNFAQKTGAAVLIIDHTGKQTSGLNHGKAIRGSGAKPATLDIYGVLDYGPTQTQRTLAIEGRVREANGASLRVDFDPDTQEYRLITDEAASHSLFDKWSVGIPFSGEGFTIQTLAALWDCARGTALKRTEEMRAAGRMRRAFGKGSGNSDAWRYWATLGPVTVGDHEVEEDDED